MVRMALARLGCDKERIATKVATVYSNLREESLGLFPDTEDVLRELVRKGVKLALLTNGAGDVQRAKLRNSGLLSTFTLV
jgi:putative hydrolase of the HAD superfamily